jgi:hypothetical protein
MRADRIARFWNYQLIIQGVIECIARYVLRLIAESTSIFVSAQTADATLLI